MDATERAKSVTAGMCGLLMRTHGAATETGYVVLENDGVAVLTANIADAIRAAVAEERERCAVVADELSMKFESTTAIATALRVAAAIREVPT